MIVNIFFFTELISASIKTNTSQTVNKPDGFALLLIIVFFLITTFFIIYNYIKRSRIKDNFKNINNILSVKLICLNSNGEYKISIKNKSKEYIEIKAPEIILKSISSKKRMKVKSENYPLTISPGTSHSIIFKKKQLIQTNNKKLSLKFFRIFVIDIHNNVLKTKYRLL